MSLLRHWKMVLGLGAIFGAGVITGVVTSVATIVHLVNKPEPVKQWVEARLKELDRRLNLTPEQREKIRPIVEKASARFRQIGADAFSDILVTARETHEELAKELTSEQRTEFDKYRLEVIAKL
ncbi:MAG: hypothetical protein RL693_1432, partial [Verrucomicrobiota bacterium]